MDIINFNTGVTASITNQTLPNTIPASTVGKAITDLATLTKTAVELVDTRVTATNVAVTGQTATISALQIAILSKADTVIGKNKFNKATTSYGFMDNTGVINTNNNNPYVYSEKIKVTAGVTYVGSADGVQTTDSRIRFTCYFKADGTVLAGGSNGDITGFTAPALADTVVITVYNTKLSTFQLEQASAPTTFEPYIGLVLSPDINLSSAKIASVGDTLYRKKTDLIGVNDTSIVNVSPNLLDPTDSAGVGKLLDSTNGTYLTIAEWYTIPLKPIVAGQSINTHIDKSIADNNSKMRNTTWYNASGGVINTPSSLGNVSTAPANAVAFRTSVKTVVMNTLMIEYGAVPVNNYVKGITTLSDKVKVYEENIIRSGITFLDTVFLGDSTVAQYLWCPLVANALSLNGINLGRSGTKFSGGLTNDADTSAGFWTDTRVNAIPLTTKILFVLGGINDWAQNVPMGVANSVNTDEINGAFNVFVTKVLTRIPTIQIIFLGTTYANAPGRTGFIDKETNALGFKTNDYANAIKEGAIRNNQYFVSTNQLGWNAVNKSTFLSDDLHPNSTGAGRIASKIINDVRYLIR